MNLSIYRQIAEAVEKAERVALLGHAMPDGDSVGSMLGMALVLEQQGKEVIRISPDPVPETYMFLPGADRVITLDRITEEYDLLIVVDCTDFGRCRMEVAPNADSDVAVINIDHHISNKSFGRINLVRPEAAATGEIIFALLNELDWPLTKDVATCLYTAIVMDTGSFTFSNTTVETHRITAALMAAGIDIDKINTLLFEEKPVLAFRLLCRALDTLSFSPCGKVAWMKISRDTMTALEAGDEHADGLVNYCKGIKGVEVGLLFREVEDRVVKVSLRSKNIVDVNNLASLFGGGGHPRAAGCLMTGTLDESVERLVKAALEML